VVLVNIIPVMLWKVIRDVLSSMNEAQAVVGCIFPRKDLVLGRPLRCVPVCVVPSVISVKCMFFYLCIVVAVYPAGNPERWGYCNASLHHDAPK